MASRAALLARALTEGCLESIAYRDMQARAPRGRQTLVQGRTIERMRKRIAARERPVGPGFTARVPQEQTSSRKLSAARLDVLGVLAERRGYGRRAKALAYGARDLQDFALVAAQALELQRDQTSQVLGNRRCDVREPTGERPPAVTLDQHTARDQIIRNVDHEQRIAFGARVDRIRKLTRPGLADRLR